MVRWLFIVVAMLAVGAGVLTWLRPPGVPVDVTNAQRQAIREYVAEEAKTRLPEIQRITMPLAGRVRPIHLREGDAVTAGQVVAELDACDLDTDLVERSTTVKRYDKNLEQIELSIEQATQTVLASQAKFDFTDRLFQRTKALSQQNSASQVKLESDELQRTEAQLGLRKDQLNKGMYEIMRGVIELMREAERAKMAKAERDRDRAQITTPVGGVVLKRLESNERMLAAGEILLEIGDPQQLQVEADILTQDVTVIEVGDVVDIEGPAIGPVAVTGKVSRIYPQGFTKVSSLGVEQQRVKVIVDFESGTLEKLKAQGRPLGVDFRVRVKIYTAAKDDAITIPRAALFRSASGNWQAFVVRDNIARRIDVEIGLRNDFDVEIVRGIEANDTLILAPDSTIEDGTRVEVVR